MRVKVAKLKGFRWNFHAKVTAFSVETQWKQKVSVGTARTASWQSDRPVSASAVIVFNDYQTLTKTISTTYNQRMRAKIKQKSKRWNVYQLAPLSAVFKFDAVLRGLSDPTSTSWVVFKMAGLLSQTRSQTLFKVVLQSQVVYNAFENPVIRQTGWVVKKAIDASSLVIYGERKIAGVLAMPSWNVDKLNIKVGTSWKSDLKLVVSRPVLSNTRITVGTSVTTGWNDYVKIYFVKTVRYKVFQTFVFIAPHQPLPRSGKPKAVIPNITYNKLSIRDKLKVK